MTLADALDNPQLSIIVPALNEQDNAAALVKEVFLSVIEKGVDAELIIVDDGSSDQTLARLTELASEYAWLRPLHRRQPRGQSAAMHAGIHAARGQWIATLDADLQNDPADLPHMLQTALQENADLVQGVRARRADSIVRKVSTWAGRTTRKWLLADDTIDTGCATRVLRIDLARQLPLHFRGMHRFVPAYSRMLGAKVVQVPVNHRPRVAGTSKYGVMNRAVVGLFDCLAIRWMIKRHCDTRATPIERKES